MTWFKVDDVYPLERLPVETQERIAREVAKDSPPSIRLYLGLARLPNRAWWEWHWQRGLAPPEWRPKISNELRSWVYDRDGHACVYCGATEDLTLDHIHPYSLGGKATSENLQTLCRPCNQRKGASV